MKRICIPIDMRAATRIKSAGGGGGGGVSGGSEERGAPNTAPIH